MNFGVVPRSDGPLALKLGKRRVYADFGLISPRKARQLAIIERAYLSRRPFEYALRQRWKIHIYRKFFPKPKKPVLPPGAAILADIAEKHGFTITELKSPRRTRLLVLARHEAAYRMYAETPLSFPQIGKVLGGRDHTTALHAVESHARRNNLPDPRGRV